MSVLKNLFHVSMIICIIAVSSLPALADCGLIILHTDQHGNQIILHTDPNESVRYSQIYPGYRLKRFYYTTLSGEQVLLDQAIDCESGKIHHEQTWTLVGQQLIDRAIPALSDEVSILPIDNVIRRTICH